MIMHTVVHLKKTPIHLHSFEGPMAYLQIANLTKLVYKTEQLSKVHLATKERGPFIPTGPPVGQGHQLRFKPRQIRITHYTFRTWTKEKGKAVNSGRTKKPPRPEWSCARFTVKKIQLDRADTRPDRESRGGQKGKTPRSDKIKEW